MEKVFDLIIVGGGPAGFTAGIYAARSGLDATVLEEGYGGGQASTSPWIENFPGFEGIGGMDLMEKMKAHAEKNLPVMSGTRVDSASREGDIFVLASGEKKYRARALIFATGARYRRLGVPGEAELIGRGVSYCATCDGMFFRGKKVAVIGGGNSGATEALHLKHIGAAVTLVHRRDTLRAEQTLQDRLKAEGVSLMLDKTPRAITGGDRVTGLRVLDNAAGHEETHDFDGVFISVGVEPNAGLAASLGVETTRGGFISTDREMRTGQRLIYAAGDVTGGLRQVVTACAGGALAAMSAYEDLRNPYWA